MDKRFLSRDTIVRQSLFFNRNVVTYLIFVAINLVRGLVHLTLLLSRCFGRSFIMFLKAKGSYPRQFLFEHLKVSFTQVLRSSILDVAIQCLNALINSRFVLGATQFLILLKRHFSI